MPKILVAGAAGFIGSRVSALLLGQGASVVGLDNLNSAYDVRLKHRRLSGLTPHPNFNFTAGDITDNLSLEKFFERQGGFDAVINLAARAGVRASVEDPWAFYETNVNGTLNLLELCRKYNVKKFVLASSSSLYGQNNPMPYREDANTDRVLSPYAASKKAAEVLCYTYYHLFKIDMTIFRYFTVYGPAGRPDMSLFRFTQWVAEGKPVYITGDGKQSRDFTYVDDIAMGTVLGLKPVGYQVFNLGNDEPFALIDALGLIEDRLKKKANIVYKPMHPADVTATRANISAARRMLGWGPQVSLERGIANLVDWYLSERSWASQIVTD